MRKYVAWGFYWVGHWVSTWPQYSFVYPIYNWLMVTSGNIQGSSKNGPWSAPLVDEERHAPQTSENNG